MAEERTVREQLAEIAPIVDQLVDVIGTAKKSFIHQRSQLLTQLNNQQDPLCRKIASIMVKMSEIASEKSEGTREPYLRLHSILTHLQIIAETTCRLEELLQRQIKDGVLFSDKAISQISYVFDTQTDILGKLADIMRNGSKEQYHQIVDECKRLGQSCLQFATDHETRLIEGLCYPRASPLFLGILDQVQVIENHEREVAQLFGNNLKTAQWPPSWLDV